MRSTVFLLAASLLLAAPVAAQGDGTGPTPTTTTTESPDGMEGMDSNVTTTVTVTEAAAGDGSNTFIWLVIGISAGAIAWALLVRGGVVQRRSRKQVASTAAHHDVARREDRPTLEARKRALMAALKDLELAKQAKEVEPAAYDAVKADLKKQTVTVMRALEDAESRGT